MRRPFWRHAGPRDVGANQILATYHELKHQVRQAHGLSNCPVELAHQIVYGAIDYAAGLRFEPQEDFVDSKWVLEKRGVFPPNEALEFGKDGKPLYVAGPDDNVAGIMAHLEREVGEDNFNFPVPLEDNAEGEMT